MSEDQEAEDVSDLSELRPGPGRPTDYDPSFCQIATDRCINGATDFEVAQELGCSVRTLYRWKSQHPEFCQALRVGKELADDRVEASMYHRAVGYSHPAVKIFMPAGAAAPVYADYIEHVPPDIGAGTLWLTNRKGAEWRSKQSLEHTGPGGGPLQAVTITTDDPVEATRAWQEMIRGG